MQLLVTDEDRHNYDLIANYTIVLKNLTEKSELWVQSAITDDVTVSRFVRQRFESDLSLSRLE